MEKDIRLLPEMFLHETPYGLPVKYIKRKGMKTFYFYVLVNYGSQEMEYVKTKQNMHCTITPGTAHFLEHKIFESKEKSTFETFSRQSASVNAYTGFSSTVYYFSCTSMIRENIDLLMRLITDTYINNETVEKEKGIIIQEIKMYYDNPGWRTFNNYLNSLYVNNTVKYDVAGGIKDVESITPEELLRVYGDFYTSDNMMVFALGDIDQQELFKAMDEAPAIPRGGNIKRVYPEEGRAVARSFCKDSMKIGESIFAMGFKEEPLGEGTDGMRKELILKIIMDYMIGPVSKLYDKLYDEALIDSTFGYGVSCGLNFAYSLISGSSKSPELVKDAFLKELCCLRAEGLEEKTFNSIKRMLLGENIRLSDNDEVFLKAIISSHNKGQDWFSMPQVLESIGIEETRKALQQMLSEKSFSLSITMPETNKG